jgi:hypothetical protein
MEGPTAFITIDALKTFAGQVVAVVMLTQVVKSSWPRISTYLLRSTAVTIAIGIHSALVWHSGLPISGYVLALLNGAAVAMAAMKGAELIKGEKYPATVELIPGDVLETQPRPSPVTAPMILLLVALGASLTGCTLAAGRMTQEQLHEYAKVKDAHVGCIKVGSPYGNGTTTWANADKGVVGEVTAECDGMKITIKGPAPK